MNRAFDSLFASMTGIIPVTFLRVLSYHESDLDPNKVTKSSNATGLFQVVQKVLDDYNMFNGTSYTLEDTKDPNLNSRIGINLVSRIVKSFQKNHPKSLGMNWLSPRFISLLVQGFNAGYSEAGGVGYVVDKMEKAGIESDRITVDTVSQAAKELGASRFLSMPKRVEYAKAVTRTYFRELNNAISSSSFRDSLSLNDLLSLNELSKEGRVSRNLYASLNGYDMLEYSDDLVKVPTLMGNTIVLLALPLTALFAGKRLFKSQRF